MNFNFLDLSNNVKKTNLDNSSNKFIENFIKELQNYLKNSTTTALNKYDYYTIDRFEGNNNRFAVCENRRTREMVDIPISQLSSSAKENDIIKYNNGLYTVDEEQTRIVEEKIKKLSEEVFKE